MPFLAYGSCSRRPRSVLWLESHLLENGPHTQDEFGEVRGRAKQGPVANGAPCVGERLLGESGEEVAVLCEPLRQPIARFLELLQGAAVKMVVDDESTGSEPKFPCGLLHGWMDNLVLHSL